MKFDITDTITILEKTPDVIELLVRDMPREWIYANEGENTWSPFDVVGHLVHGEKTDWVPRMKIILDQNSDKKFSVFDRFAQLKENEGKSIRDVLNEFKILRKQNLAWLQSVNLNEDILNSSGIHPAFGAVTLRQLLATWAAHDLSHIVQISRVMAKQYREEIGPWTAYLSIFKSN